jgi:hypothetical protein
MLEKKEEEQSCPKHISNLDNSPRPPFRKKKNLKNK